MKTRRLTIDSALDDLSGWDAGDVIISTRTVYRVIDARPVESKVWGNRWSVEVTRIGAAVDHVPLIEIPGGARVRPTTRYAPGETPAEFFGSMEPA